MQEQKFKADAGKPDHSLLELGFPHALAFVQATLDYGAIKYEAHSWRKVPNAFNRYDKAARRHRNQRDAAVSHARLNGNTGFLYADDESGLPHIAHELFNLMAQIELYLQDNPGIDVRQLLKFNQPPTAHKYREGDVGAQIAPSLSGDAKLHSMLVSDDISAAHGVPLLRRIQNMREVLVSAYPKAHKHVPPAATQQAREDDASYTTEANYRRELHAVAVGDFSD